MKKHTKRFILVFAALMLTMTSVFACFTVSVSAANTADTQTHVTIDGAETVYTIFASGNTSSEGYEYSSSSNYNDTTLTNGGFDLYSSYFEYDGSDPCKTIRLGRSFTIGAAISEKVKLSVRAFDTDEEDGETDAIFLVDETAGKTVRIGALSGRDWQWNTTTFELDPSLLTVGHTYYIRLTEEVWGWHVWVRNVTFELSAPAFRADLDGSIDKTACVSGTLTASAASETYNVEFKAVETATGYQRGGLQTTMSVIPAGSSIDYSFELDSVSPEGIYQISAIFTDRTTGEVECTVSIYRGFPFSAVSYNANLGTSNLPVDTNRYTSGDSVTVLYDYLPSRTGYEFLGWSRDRNATEPEFTQTGNNTFVIGEDDVTLYAIWEAAPGTATLIIGDGTARAGETVTLGFTLSNMEEIKSILLYDFTYDDSKVELVDAAWTLSGGDIIDWNLSSEEAAYAFAENTEANGEIFTLTFKVLEGTADGEIDISCSAVIKEKTSGMPESSVAFTVIPGKITVDNTARGDFNGDEYVDSDDAIYLLKHTLAPEKYPLNQNGDVNGDGQVDSDDAVYLLKHTLAPEKYPLS